MFVVHDDHYSPLVDILIDAYRIDIVDILKSLGIFIGYHVTVEKHVDDIHGKIIGALRTIRSKCVAHVVDPIRLRGSFQDYSLRILGTKS